MDFDSLVFRFWEWCLPGIITMFFYDPLPKTWSRNVIFLADLGQAKIRDIPFLCQSPNRLRPNLLIELLSCKNNRLIIHIFCLPVDTDPYYKVSGFFKKGFLWMSSGAGAPREAKVQKYGYFLPLGNEIPTFLNFLLDFGLKLWLFKYHG